MDLSNFVTYDKKESLLLSIAKSNQAIVEKTHSKPQEFLEVKVTEQKKSFSFDVPLNLDEKWMMEVTSLEVYNIVINITEKNNKLQILLNDEQFDALDIITVVMSYMKKLYESYEPGQSKLNEFIEKANIFLIGCYETRKKLTKKDFDYLKQTNNNIPITIPDFEIVDGLLKYN